MEKKRSSFGSGFWRWSSLQSDTSIIDSWCFGVGGFLMKTDYRHDQCSIMKSHETKE